MSRTAARASGPNWLAAVVGAIALAVVFAWFTTPRVASRYPSPALPPAAHATSQSPTSAAPATVATASSGASVNRASYNMEAGQKISIDPATGQARPIEHDDAAQTGASARRTSVEGEQVLHPSGAVGIAIPETSDVYTVATKSPSGATSIAHAEGRTAAVRQATTKTRRPAVKEVLNDR